MKRELVFLRSFATASACIVVFLSFMAFNQTGNQRFNEIDVERINIIEPDGTVKMIITNVGRFPNGKDTINNRPTNVNRKKRSGMLFFNEDGIECGGFIYDGQKKGNGHSSGLSLTYDQYDGDQVMQLLTQDYTEGEKRRVTSSLVFNDRPAKETQQRNHEISMEIEALRQKNPAEAQKKLQEYEAQGLIGGAPRIMLGQSRSQNNGLFLFDDKGMPKAMFYVDKENKAKLDFFDDKGTVIASFPDNSSK
ncbi:hypothetical protein M0M57_11215 [Flavobacterium azooxidireducens]|uniref:Uncharacterized protein n=1 Tax=Flavobacterium azooxidireducens TaxID=1871076 RepID=A0ABY4KBM6_9FLAO|nr:hypothetical protein [Flavobacterium azooxidireducens]UPQ78192.1 hypothetical protein M0M57_11215 [Flavobacterium azooxidireducens]